MSPRGGTRKGAGRPSPGGWKLDDHKKLTIEAQTHALIKAYAEKSGIPIIDFMHKLFHHPDIETLIDKINPEDKTNKESNL